MEINKVISHIEENIIRYKNKLLLPTNGNKLSNKYYNSKKKISVILK